MEIIKIDIENISEFKNLHTQYKLEIGEEE